ncbi:hypothetical protein D3C76_167740 [compost metagenome]
MIPFRVLCTNQIAASIILVIPFSTIAVRHPDHVVILVVEELFNCVIVVSYRCFTVPVVILVYRLTAECIGCYRLFGISNVLDIAPNTGKILLPHNPILLVVFINKLRSFIRVLDTCHTVLRIIGIGDFAAIRQDHGR